MRRSNRSTTLRHARVVADEVGRQRWRRCDVTPSDVIRQSSAIPAAAAADRWTPGVTINSHYGAGRLAGFQPTERTEFSARSGTKVASRRGTQPQSIMSASAARPGPAGSTDLRHSGIPTSDARPSAATGERPSCDAWHFAGIPTGLASCCRCRLRANSETTISKNERRQQLEVEGNRSENEIRPPGHGRPDAQTHARHGGRTTENM